VRIPRVLLILVLAAACEDEPEPEPAPVPRLPAGLPGAGKWQAVRFEDVAFMVPEEFARKVRDYQNGQRLFFGPAVNGFEPSVQVIRQPFSGTTREWFERWRDKHRQGPRGITRVIDSGSTTVAGLAAYELVYQIPQDDRVFKYVAWLWVRNGHGYIVRGLAEDKSFAAVYRPVFEKVKSTVRLMP
jgi:hypothetical protein